MVISEENFEHIRQTIGRSGRGKDGKGEWRESKLSEMSDNWVENSIKWVGNYAEDQNSHVPYYKLELVYRKKHGITISDEDPLTIVHGTIKKIGFS
jgi:hypothetical protein